MSNQVPLTIIYFTQPGCLPCKVLKPHLDRFAKKYANSIVIQEVDADTRAGGPYAERWNVRGLPTLVFTRGKEMTEVARSTGFKPGDEIKIEATICGLIVAKKERAQ